MKNKVIQLIILTLSLIVIIILVNTYRHYKISYKLDENTLTEIRTTQESNPVNSHNNETKKTEDKNLITPKTTSADNLQSYINDSFINSNDVDIFVSVINDEGIISSYLSNAIVEIYNQAGYKGKLGLFKNSFYKKQSYKELFYGNPNTIQKLNLRNHTDFLALGTISYETQKGSLVEGSIVCTATLSINIICTSQNRIIKNFTLTSNGNGASEYQAIEYANNKLLVIYNTSYSSLE